MAEETQKPAAAAEEVVVEKPVTEKDLTQEKPTEESSNGVEGVVEAEKPKPAEEDNIAQSASFKEESNVVGELPDPQKKALDELKQLIQEALNNNEFTAPQPVPAKDEAKEPEAPKEEVKSEEPKTPKTEDVKPTVETEPLSEVVEDGAKTVVAIEETIVAAKPEAEELAPATTKEADEVTPAVETKEAKAMAEVPPPPPEDVYIWGIPLLGDERSDTILLKFLRARDFKVNDAFTMIKNTVRWRKEFGIDALLEEDLGNELDKVVFMHGFDKEGHPVCYNVYGEFQNKELYQNTFADDEKRTKFLRSRIQFLEKSIRKLDFSPNGICTIVQINDLNNSPGPSKRELRLATNQALQLLQDNYPEFVAKQVFINVPWWYLAFNRMISPFLTQRTKSKFVFAGPSKSAETLFKYIAPQQVPVQYGGLSREQEFTTSDSVTEVIVKPSSKYTVEIPITKTSVLVWELRVLRWDVSYGAEFMPSSEGSYTVIVSKTRKVAPTDEPVICDTFKSGEPGKVVLTIDNQSSKKKKLLYRSKTKPSLD